MLKLKHIVKDYVTKQQTVNVLKDVTLNFRDCEFVTILGQSGCGKTTLLNIIGGLDRYTSGDIIINGKSTKDFDDRDWDKYRNKQIGFVFQTYNLIPHLDVLHNVELSLTLAGKSKDERKEIALEVLRDVGLEDQAYKKPNQLSGGQMQRVAIARALVNNPSIILADEPTGALDTESGVMVMELLKEVAKDRLVILVSHNVQLANEYSTRIVKLTDGIIIDDSNPFIDETEIEEEVAPVEVSACKKTIRQRLKKPLKQVQKERREERKVSMKESTTIALSAKNLYSKKWRTFLTSFAGSIGIIGIALVLALSSGVNRYIAMTEESALSVYPLTISKEGTDLMELANVFMKGSTGEKYPNTSNVFINKVVGNITFEQFTGDLLTSNDLRQVKRLLDSNLSDKDGYVKYNYNSGIHIYRQIPDSEGNLITADNYTKVNPFVDSMPGLFQKFEEQLGQFGVSISSIADVITGELGGMLDMFNMFSELITNQSLLEQQYDVIAGEWASQEGYPELDADGNPTGVTIYDCVIQVDAFNKINDFMLFAAGLLHPQEVLDMMAGMFGDASASADFYDRFFTEEELLDVEYSVLSDSDYYEVNSDGSISENAVTRDEVSFVNAKSNIKLRVSGVVRAKENTSGNSITGIVGYPQALMVDIITRCANSDIAKAQAANLYELRGNTYYKISGVEIISGDTLEVSIPATYDSTHLYMLNVLLFNTAEVDATAVDAVDADINRTGTISSAAGERTEDIYNDAYKKHAANSFGWGDLSSPDSISIYAASFEGKENIVALLSENNVKYSDFFSTIMGYVKQLTDTMIKALIAFSAISLIVSSIMIAIITYTSVLERRKEIGILRSIGARKLDISNLFISESSIIGIISGILGVSFGYMFVAIANAALASVLEIRHLLSLDWYFALTLIVISFVLSLVAGIIPSSIAANKDPVQALRAE